MHFYFYTKFVCFLFGFSICWRRRSRGQQQQGDCSNDICRQNDEAIAIDKGFSNNVTVCVVVVVGGGSVVVVVVIATHDVSNAQFVRRAPQSSLRKISWEQIEN